MTRGEPELFPERTVSHLVHEPGDKKVRCGLLTASVPTCWERWAQAHIDGHDAQFCPACTDGLDLTAIDKRNDGDP